MRWRTLEDDAILITLPTLETELDEGDKILYLLKMKNPKLLYTLNQIYLLNLQLRYMTEHG